MTCYLKGPITSKFFSRDIVIKLFVTLDEPAEYLIFNLLTPHLKLEYSVWH